MFLMSLMSSRTWKENKILFFCNVSVTGKHLPFKQQQIMLGKKCIELETDVWLLFNTVAVSCLLILLHSVYTFSLFYCKLLCGCIFFQVRFLLSHLAWHVTDKTDRLRLVYEVVDRFVCLSFQLMFYAAVCLRTCAFGYIACLCACLSVCPRIMFTSVSFAKMIAFSNRASGCKSCLVLTHSLLFLLSCSPKEASKRQPLTFTGTFTVALRSLQARCRICLVL